MKTCLFHLGLWQAVPLGPDSKEHPIYSSNEDLSPPPGTLTGCSAGTWQQGTSYLFIKWRPVSSTWDSDRLFRWALTLRNILFTHHWWRPVFSTWDSDRLFHQDLSSRVQCYLVTRPMCPLIPFQVVEHLSLFYSRTHLSGTLNQFILLFIDK